MNLVQRSEVAELAGVSRSALTQAVSGRLRPACVGKGRKLRIDVEHPVTQTYIDEKRRNGTTAAKHNGAKPPANGADQVPKYNGIPVMPNGTDRIEDLEELTVREVALKYGGVAGFVDYVKALKGIADYKNKELLARQRRGELIERETTGASLVALVDAAFKRLVGEMPGSITQQLVPLIMSGGESAVKDAEKLLAENISKILKDCKGEVVKKLRTLDKDPDR